MPHWSDQMASAYIANVANRYIVDKPLSAFDIFPMVPTQKITGYIGTYTKVDWLRIGSTDLYKRIGATESFGDDYAVSKVTYLAEQYSFHKDITRDDMNEYDNPFSPVNDAVDFVMTRMNRVLLKELIATFFTTSIWSGAADQSLSGTLWSAKTSGISVNDPIAHINVGRAGIMKQTGYNPNKFIVTWDAYNALLSNTFITDRMKLTSDKVVTKDLLARLFEVDQFIVLDSVNEAGTDFLSTSRALLCYTPATPSKFSPSAGYNIVYNGGDIGRAVKSRKIIMPEKNDAVRIEADMYLDQLVLGADLGVYFYGMV
jgi:hypothetical protein